MPKMPRVEITWERMGKTMPNKPRPENRHRMVRVEDALWDAAKVAAAGQGTTVSAVIRAALAEYVERHS